MSKILSNEQPMENGEFKDSTIDSKANDLMLKGQFLNSSDTFNQEAFNLLSKAIKLNPYLIEAWIELTKCYQKRFDIDGAIACLENALKYCNSNEPNKIILRKLSSCIRQKNCDNQEVKIAALLRSLDLSKQALKCDMLDEENYYNLAKAYLCLFFATECVDQQLIFLSKAAYLKALSLSDENHSKVKLIIDQQSLSDESKDIGNKFNKMNSLEEPQKPFIQQSDFLFNFSTVLVYLQEFQKAIEYLRIAINLDKDWDEPKTLEECLVDYLRQIYLMTNDMCKNPKKVIRRYNKVVESLKSVTKIENIILMDQKRLLKSTDIRVKPIDLNQLLDEYNNFSSSTTTTPGNQKDDERKKEDNQTVKILHLKLIGTINYNQAMYLTFIGIDRNYSIIVLTIYNLAASKCPTPKDVVTIIDPKIEEIVVDNLININNASQKSNISFKRISVREFKSLYVNGYRITRDQVSKPQFKVSVLP